MFKIKHLRYLFLMALVIILGAALLQTSAQDEAEELRVETAVTGELTADSPTILYSFRAQESLRMGFNFDVDGDMEVSLTVFDQDGETVLGESSGSNNNGIIVTFPSEGDYTVSLSADGGTSVTYRLMIDADPALPLNTFIVQSYLVSGTSVLCAENTPVGFFTSTEDLNVCFTLGLIGDTPIELTVQWWSPSGEVVNEESATYDSSLNFETYLTGIVYNGSNAFDEGWWQVHFLIDGELAHIQWVTVSG